MEHWQEVLDVVLAWSFLPVAVVILFLVTVGTGLLKTRWKRTAWVIGLILAGFVLYFGLQRHEWGEVLFNGQLL